MVAQYDSSAEEVGRTIADLIKGSRLLPDMADIWRALGERCLRDRMRSASADLVGDTLPDNTAQAIGIRANALLVDAGMRVGLDWQRLVSRRVPAIRRRLDDYRAEPDPLPEVRNALLDEVGLFLTELAEFASDQGRALQQDIERFQRKLLRQEPQPTKRSAPQPHRKRFSSSAEARLAASVHDLKRALSLENDMARLDNAIKDWCGRADPHIRGLLNHQFDCDAKYFRPLTVFSCHRAVSDERIPETLITSAQAVEMFHNASLIIDDLVDKSDTRRNKPTLHAMHGELTAYMVAGYIVADGYDIIARQAIDDGRDRPGTRPDSSRQDERSAPASTGSSDRSTESAFRAHYANAIPPAVAPGEVNPTLDVVGPVRFDLRLLSELLKRLAVAECVQWQARKQPYGLQDWYWLAREDTGSMFEVCACLGARDQRLRKFGRLLGMLYHGCDDVADLFEEDTLGGGGNEDVDEGILTLPAALAIRDDHIQRMFCEGDRTDPKVKKTLQDAFRRQGEAAHRTLDQLAATAKSEIASLRLRAPDILIDLVDYTRQLAPAIPRG